MNELYPIGLEVISPLSINSGKDNEWVRGIDYVVKDKQVYVLDQNKMAQAGVDLDRLSQLFLNNDEAGICTLLGNQLKEVSSYHFTTSVASDNPIKPFLRTQLYDRPIIAGSSIKGAIRSALFNQLRENERDNKPVFGDLNDGSDFMRFIQVSDVEMSSTILLNSKIFNLMLNDEGEWQGGWKHQKNYTSENYKPYGFNTLFECVPPGMQGYGYLTLLPDVFDWIRRDPLKSVSHAEKKNEIIHGGYQALFHAVNVVTRGYLEKEKAFFQAYPAIRTDEILEQIHRLQAMIPENDSACLLKMSAGVGFHSITGDWQFEDYDKTGYWADSRNAGKKMYKSRKTVEYSGRLNLMGFVRLRALNAAEAEGYEQRLQQEHEAIKEQLAAPIREREAARIRQAEADAERARAAAEEAQKRADYDSLIQQARQFFENRRWQEAIAKAEEAAALLPGTEHQHIIDDCKRELAIDAANTIITGGTEALLGQPLAEALKGKTSVGNLVGTLAKWLKGENNAFTDTEQVAFLSAVHGLPEKERKKLTGKRKDLIKAIGEEQTTKLFIALGL